MSQKMALSKLKEEVKGKLQRHFGETLEDATKKQIYKALSLTLRDQMMRDLTETESFRRKNHTKKLYYLSFEFLIGRLLKDNLMSLGETELYKEMLAEFDLSLEDVAEMEPDAGLGNGGLGRLAACFLNSLSTLDYPAYGAGIRYEYGLFRQRIIDGYQVEMPDEWLEDGFVWEVEHAEEQVEVHFGGHVESYWEDGRMRFFTRDATTVIAVPYDMPVLGYGTRTVNTLRLWSAKAKQSIDLRQFSHGNYTKALEEKSLAETLSKVLYPDDNHQEGKMLRLKQQYFFTAATLKWILREFKKMNRPMSELPDYVAIQINDTHPAVAIGELMRILLDEECMEWDDAWNITRNVFGYTNHTIMSEALERWNIHTFRELLPRVYMIIEEINRRLEIVLRERFGDDWGKINYMLIISEGNINMANLCIAGSHCVNGVSQLHGDILRQDLFHDYYSLEPEKFIGITNGITQRRWLGGANPKLTELMAEALGSRSFLKDYREFEKLKPFAKDSAFIERFAKIKRENKERLAEYIQRTNGVIINPDSIFDVQVKRLHEYKRQLLNILHIQHLYNQIKDHPEKEFRPHTFIFGAKAAPGYLRAKNIIKLINTLAEKINNDPIVGDKLKVVFIENYCVSLAELIMPATEVSEQISTAGKEASGTGNMKFMMNGALTVGTLDGANVEMAEKVGMENMYIFGLRADEVQNILRLGNTVSREAYTNNHDLRRVMNQLVDGSICRENQNLFNDLHNALLYGDNGLPDPYMVLADFESYVQIHEVIARDYADQQTWNQKAVLNVAASGFFSSDRTIDEYNDLVWRLR